MPPVSIGAALDVADLPAHRDWLIEGQRDLELTDFYQTEVILGDWQSRVAEAKRQLDGYDGRLGVHGPFYGVAIDNNDPEIGPLVTRRYQIGLDITLALGATQMVLHSPFTTWDHYNFGDHPAQGNQPSAKAQKIQAVHDVIGPVVARAEEHGVTLVFETIEDMGPGDWIELAESFGSDEVRLSLDTGHTQYCHVSHSAPPLDYFVAEAGDLLAHVHLQDADGYADRHWPPGRGSINWHALFAALEASPADPHLVLELRYPQDVLPGFNYLKDLGLVV